MRTAIAAAALVGLGAAGGQLLGMRTAPPTAISVMHSPDVRPIVVAGSGVSAAELRRVVREELTAAGAERSAGPVVPPAPSVAANPAAFDDGMQRVRQAIAQRRWTPDDTAALDRTLAAMSPEERTEILHTLVPALNRGEIKLTAHSAAF